MGKYIEHLTSKDFIDIFKEAKNLAVSSATS